MIAIGSVPWCCFYSLLPALAALPAVIAGAGFWLEITPSGGDFRACLAFETIFLTSFYPL
ncbi:hypothetical protein [Azonexus sp.]|uniref:hypothetical protein n=1 Tax=Azonexus sp. TaxID=1872668 RepID=UPI0035AD9677